VRRALVIALPLLTSGCFDFVHHLTEPSPALVVTPPCANGLRDGDESDVDCGGTCTARCGLGARCKVSGDCASTLCLNSACDTPSCHDGVKNQGESDVDCGGSCPACGSGKACGGRNDCASLVCAQAVCAAPSCTDATKNQTESDVDCGGGCPACANGSACGAAGDCASAYCNGSSVCASPTCTDGAKNADETDVDCGGSCPTRCANSGTCKAASDCVSAFCNASGVCASPTCSDGARNGDETDIDCGGSCPNDCAPGQGCSFNGDCTSHLCGGVTCLAPKCDDGVLNGSESATDCGGAQCPKCSIGKTCAQNGDCWNNACSGTCTATCPATMAGASSVNGAYCIDKFEVSNANYAAWLATNPPVAMQKSYCAWNTTFQPCQSGAPGGGCSPICPFSVDGGALPVRCVNWCDGQEYCRWHGMRLCGKIGAADTGIVGAEVDDHTLDQWFNVCSAGGTQSYGYTGAYNAATCNTGTSGPTGTTASTFPACTTGGAYDFSGNVSEFTADCVAPSGPTDSCGTRGGAFSDGSTSTCGGLFGAQRNSYNQWLGFRCCSNP
jgi:hypothetical protein